MSRPIERPFTQQDPVPQVPDQPPLSRTASLWKDQFGGNWANANQGWGSGSNEDWNRFAEGALEEHGQLPKYSRRAIHEDQEGLASYLKKARSSEARDQILTQVAEELGLPSDIAERRKDPIYQSVDGLLSLETGIEVFGPNGERATESTIMSLMDNNLEDADKNYVARALERYRYALKFPTASISLREAAIDNEVFEQEWAKGGAPRIARLAQLVQPHDPVRATRLLSLSQTLLQDQQAALVFGVGSDDPGVNEYALNLAMSNIAVTPKTEGQRKQVIAVAERQIKLLRDAYASGSIEFNVDEFIGAKTQARRIGGAAGSRFGSVGAGQVSIQQQLSGTGGDPIDGARAFFQSEEAREAIGVIAGQRNVQATLAMAEAHDKLFGPALLQFGTSLIDVLDKYELSDAEDPAQAVLDALTVEERTPSAVLDWFVDVLGSGSRLMAALPNSGAQAAVRGFVFSDGTVETDALQAAAKYLDLLDQGRFPGMHPDMERANKERLQELGADPGNLIQRAVMGLQGFGEAIAEEIAPELKPGYVVYAAPVTIVDVVDDPGLEAAWEALSGVFEGEGDFMYEALARRANVGRFDDPQGRLGAFVADVILDPWNFVSFGAVGSTRQAIRAQQKLRMASNKALVRQGKAPLEPIKGKGKGRGWVRQQFDDGTPMTPEGAAAMAEISDRMGGTLFSDLTANWILSRIRESPDAMRNGIRQIIIDNKEHVKQLLIKSGDNRILDAQSAAYRGTLDESLAKGLEPSAAHAAAREQAEIAGDQALKVVLDESVPKIHNVLDGVRESVPTGRFSFGDGAYAALKDGHRGIRFSAFGRPFATIPVTPVTRPAQRAASAGVKKLGEIKAAVAKGFKLTESESLVAKAFEIVDKTIRYPFAVMSDIGQRMRSTHFQTITRAGSRLPERKRIGSYTRRLYKLAYGNVFAKVTEEIPIGAVLRIEESLPEASRGRLVRELLSSAEDGSSDLRNLLSSVYEVTEGGMLARTTDEIIEDLTRYGVPELQTVKNPRRAIEEYMPMLRAMREDMDDAFIREASSGYHTQAMREGYLPLIYRQTESTAAARAARDVRPLEIGVDEVVQPSTVQARGGIQGEAPQMARRGETLTAEASADAAQGGSWGNFERDIFALYVYRMEESEVILRTGQLVRLISTSVGTPIVRGARAMDAMLVEHGKRVRAASDVVDAYDTIGLPARTRGKRDFYDQMSESLVRAIKNAEGDRGIYIRLKNRLGLSTASMLNPDAVAASLRKPETLRSLARKRDSVWDKVITDPVVRDRVRNTAKMVLDGQDKARRLLNQASRLGLRVRNINSSLEEALEDVAAQLAIAGKVRISEPARRKLLNAANETLNDYRAQRRIAQAELRNARARVARARASQLRVAEAATVDAKAVTEASTGARKDLRAALRRLVRRQKRVEATKKQLEAMREKAPFRDYGAIRDLNYRLEKLMSRVDDAQAAVDRLLVAYETVSTTSKAERTTLNKVVKENARAAKIAKDRAEHELVLKEAQAVVDSWTEAIDDFAKYRKDLKAELRGAEKQRAAQKRGAEREAKKAQTRSVAIEKRRQKLADDIATAQRTAAVNQEALDQILRGTDMQQVAAGVNDFTRVAAGSEAKVRSIISRLEALRSPDVTDVLYNKRSEYARRARNQKISPPTLDQKLAREGVREGDVNFYVQASDLLDDAGITGDLRGTMLWDMYGVTKLTELSVDQVNLLLNPGGPLLSLSDAVGTSAVATFNGRLFKGDILLDDVGTKLGLDRRATGKQKGLSDRDLNDALVERIDFVLDDLLQRPVRELTEDQRKIAKAFSAEELRRIRAMAQSTDEAAVPSKLPATFDRVVEDVVSRSDRAPAMGDYILGFGSARGVQGRSQFFREMDGMAMTVADAAVLRTMIGDPVISFANGVAASVVGEFMQKLGQAWRMTVTTSTLGPAFAVRQKIDAMSSQLHIAGFATFNPMFRKELRDLFRGKIDGIQTPYGWLARDTVMELYERTVTAVGKRHDVTRTADSIEDATRRADDLATKSLIESEMARRGTRRPMAKGAASAARVREHKGPITGMTIGGLIGATLGGPGLAFIGASTAYALTKTRQAMRRGVTGTAGRAIPTWREYLVPVGAAGAQVNEDYTRAMILLYNLKSGKRPLEALEDTLVSMRDYSNYKPEERLFQSVLPIAFYNFTKQNTIAQVRRIMDNPGYPAQYMKFLDYLSEELPPEALPDWIAKSNAVVRSGRAWFFPSEISHPWELLDSLGATVAIPSKLWAGEGVDLRRTVLGMVSPYASEPIRRAFEGRLLEERPMPQSMAKELYDKYGPMHTRMLRIYVGKDGQVQGTINGLFSLSMVALGMESIMRNGARMNEAIMRDEVFAAGLQFFAGIKAYKIDSVVKEQEKAGVRAFENLAELSRHLTVDEKTGQFVVEMVSALSVEEYEAVKLLVKYGNKVKSMMDDLANFSLDPGGTRQEVTTGGTRGDQEN